MQEVRNGHISDFFDTHAVVSVDYQFQPYAILTMEVSRIIAPKAALTHIARQCQTVCQVHLNVQCHGTAIDKGILIRQSSTVICNASPQFTLS